MRVKLPIMESMSLQEKKKDTRTSFLFHMKIQEEDSDHLQDRKRALTKNKI
jgi:hypothetical protein